MTDQVMTWYLLGAGGHGSVVLDALLAQGKKVAGIFDPGLAPGHRKLGVTVLGDDALLDGLDRTSSRVVNGIGIRPGSDTRQRMHQRCKQLGFEVATVLHPSAVIAHEVLLAEGCQVMAGAVLQTGTTLGAGTVVNTRASIDHDCRIGAHVFVAPGATVCGGVSMEDGAFIGAGAVILPGVSIGANAVVAAGAVVNRSVPPGRTVAGNPAAELKKSSKS